ncbi:MAG: nucleotidyltransferase domain-containing protein [Chloroflexota bacterium]|nr:nucleotidyltransferase domain-containing protein [Chloroflexota bacterium]
MIALIEDNREAIVALCEQFGVRRLSVFGSAAKGTFDPEHSDVDFLVDLGDYDDRVGRRYMRLIVGLEDLLGRRADVVTERAVSDPAFRRELDSTAKVIYGSATRTAAA